ncbi:hypothetical protein niasHT_008419 [Heterodera trifolii]|uniref:Uncharacterized protein n=1 Tax=Heterodera trifolii TaxID=157864 RepID=A0ABD2M234_9BILA
MINFLRPISISFRCTTASQMTTWTVTNSTMCWRSCIKQTPKVLNCTRRLENCRISRWSKTLEMTTTTAETTTAMEEPRAEPEDAGRAVRRRGGRSKERQTLFPRRTETEEEALRCVVNIFMSAVIDAKAFKRISDYIAYAKGAEVKKDGTRLVFGGKCDDSRGWFIEPTCVEDITSLLKQGANVDCETVRGETPLHLAARANQTVSLADHRQPHSGSDMEMGGEEEDGLSNGGGRKMLKMESSSPVNNSKMIFIGPVKPIVQQSPTAPQKLPKVELRNQSIMLDLSDPKTVSPPKFKPIGELSDYQQQINGSKGMQEFSNIRLATPPPQPSPMLRNVPLPPAISVNDMMVDRNYIAKGVSPPKFKPIGELSDYQQQINGSQEVSNIRFATPPPQPPPVLRNVPLPPVTTNNNEMMVDRTCRNNTAKPSASDFGLAGSSSSTSTGEEEDDAQLFGRRVVKFLRSLNNGRRACIGIEQVMIEFETEEE